MKGMNDLGVVDTIYEDDLGEASSSSSSFPSPPVKNNLLTSLQKKVDAWSLKTGMAADVLIRVEDQCFHLHKKPLTSKSRYLKRHLSESSGITLFPGSKIRAETFAAIAEFCYGSDIAVTPFNFAALRITAELLEMTEDNDSIGCNLHRTMEEYFTQVVALDAECSAIILRSCRPLLYLTERTAELMSRCIETLFLTDGVERVERLIDGVRVLTADEFLKVASSMEQRFIRSHDILYRTVDLYFSESVGELTEEMKIQICTTIDCTKLSQNLLIHAVQNPKLPLRFVVRAMLAEHLNHRRSVINSVSGIGTKIPEEKPTLGVILRREAALKQVNELKASLQTTSARIQSLERELESMKKLLRESEPQKRVESEPSRSSSCRFLREEKQRLVVDSARATSCRFETMDNRATIPPNPATSKSTSGWVGKRLIDGLKNAFRVTSKRGSLHDRGLDCDLKRSPLRCSLT